MRMSVISKKLQGTWLAGNDDFDNYISKILDSSRLDQHFKLFEDIALASLVNQKNFDINNNLTLIILTTDRLNVFYREKLNNYCDRYPWVKVSYLNDDCTLKDYNSLLIEEVERITNATKKGTLFATVRLDDDDALSVNFCQRLSKYLDKNFIGFGYACPRGTVGFLNQLNKFESFHQYYATNIALGLSFINYYAYSKQKFHSPYISVYDLGSHTKVDRVVPVITDATYLAYLRTRHVDSDSDSDARVKRDKKNPVISNDLVVKNIYFNKVLID